MPTGPNSKKAGCWKFFAHLENNKYRCLTCDAVVKYSGATTNLNAHLKKHEVKKEQLSADLGEPRALETVTSMSAKFDEFWPRDTRDLGATSILEKPKPEAYSLKSAKNTLYAKDRTELIAYLAAYDNMSFSMIVKSFAVKIAFFSLGYKPPGSVSGVGNAVEDFFDKAKTRIQKLIRQKIDEGIRFSLILDEWTGCNMQNFINVILHDGTLPFNLGLIPIPNRATGSEIFRLTLTRLSSFDVDFSCHIVAVTTDGAAAVKLAFKDKGVYHQLCLNHGIHLSISKNLFKKKVAAEEDDEWSVLEEEDSNNTCDETFVEMDDSMDYSCYYVSNVITRVRKIVKFFKRSTNHYKTLKSIFIESKRSFTSLVLDVVTRWNSTAAMIERFLEAFEDVNKCLIQIDNGDKVFIDDEKRILIELSRLFGPIKDTVLSLSSSNFNLYLADIYIEELINELNKTPDIEYYNTIHNSLVYEYELRRNVPLINMTMYLYNNRHFFEKLEGEEKGPETIENTRKDLIHLYNRLKFTTDVSEIQVQKPDHVYALNMKERIQGRINASQLRSLNCANKSDPRVALQSFEASNEESLIIKRLKSALNSVQATSTASERTFSISGMVLTKSRSQLRHKMLDMLVFLKYFFLRSKVPR